MVNKKGKGARTKGSKPPAKKPQQENTKDLTQQSSQERVTLVRPLWETLTQDERVRLLSIDLDNVRARAKQLAEAARQQAVADAPEGELLDPALLELEPSIEYMLEEGIKRLKEKGTWKLWQWPADNSVLYDAESFRHHITEKHIREELRRFLPRDEGRTVEKPAEAAFRQRMLDLLAKVQQSNNANSLRPSAAGASGEDGATRPYRRRGDPGSHLRDTNIELLSVLLEALAKENDHLYHSLLTPISTYVMEILPEGHRDTTKLELSFEDLENLVPDDVTRIVEWLTEKVDALSTKLKPEPKEDEEEEEENMGDVDLWSLNEEGNCLTVNSKWLQHLQDRLLGEDGHPRRAKQGEDPGHIGLVLEWVYGSIVSTAEKARDGAKRCLGMSPPTAADAHILLVRALEEHLSWETRAKQCKDLLSEMLKSRLEAAELTRQGFDLRPQPKRELPGMGSEVGQATTVLDEGAIWSSGVGFVSSMETRQLPDELILFMLRREALLTRAKLHYLVFEHLTQEKELRILKQALRQGEPEFERLKRELDEVKHQPRGIEGAYRSAAEMERHRHQVEVQTAFREQGARLQATYDKKTKVEYDMAKRETEIKQLQGWKGTVENLVDKFHELINCKIENALAASSGGAESGALKETEVEGDLESASGSLTPQQHIQLTKMRNHFFKDVRKQLYGDAEDRTFFDSLKNALKVIEKRLEDSSVALQHLEMQLINVACDDPGAIIGTQLALPLLQERLDQRGLEYAAQRAKLAEDEVLRMELLAAEREAAERERKKAAKAKKNEKAKSEKERLAAERHAKEQAERAARQEAERERAVRDEEQRRRRFEAMEAMRKAEEAAMELRRKELLSDENGYWRRRMIMEERLSGMAVAGGGNDRIHVSAVSSSDSAEDPDRNCSCSPEEIRRHGDNFVTENRSRRHKDTRDQDEVAAPAPAPTQAGTGTCSSTDSGRAHLRSSSRERMGARDGTVQRERGEHYPQRDRESNRHQGSTSAPAQRSGSREGGGRQGSHSGGGVQQTRRPPPAAPATVTVAAAIEVAMPLSSLAVQVSSLTDAIAAGDASQSEASASGVAAASTIDPAEPEVQPQADYQLTEEAREADGTVGLPEASGALSSPHVANVPEDAILFGDIAVIPLASGITATSTQTKPAAHQIANSGPNPLAASEVDQLAVLEDKSDFRQETLGDTQQHPGSTQVATQQQTLLPQPQQLPDGPNSTFSPQQAQQVDGQSRQPQQQPLPGPSVGSGVTILAPTPLGTLATGQVVHSIGQFPPTGLPGTLGIGPPMIAHMGTPGPPGAPVAGAPRSAGPAPGPPHGPYLHVNGALQVPMPPMGAVLPKQLSGQQMPPPPPPPGTVLVSIAAPPGTRTPMPGPGLPGPPPPVMVAPPPGPQASMQVGTPIPVQQQPPAGPMARQGGPMAGLAGPPNAQTGLVQMPHPQGHGQLPHSQLPGTGSRGGTPPQGQPPVMIAPMQFPGPIPGGGMPMHHGQAPTGPMGHVPPPLYVFPPSTQGMVPPPGAAAQLQPHSHPHMLQMVPPGVPLTMGPPPPQLHMQPPQQAQPAPGQGPAIISTGTQPPPPPKSPPASAGGKPNSTLNANARSFVPSGKAAAPSAGGAAVVPGSQTVLQQPQGGAMATGGTGGGQVAHQSQQQLTVRGYQRHNSVVTDGSGSTIPQQGNPPGSYPHVGPAGPFTNSSQPPVPGGNQYGGRRERRDGPRGGPGPRKGSTPSGPHVVMSTPADMGGASSLVPPHSHAGASAPIPFIGPGGPVIMVMGPSGPLQMPIHGHQAAHGPVVESVDGGPAVSSPAQAHDSSAEDSSRTVIADSAVVSTPAGILGGHPGHPPQPLQGPGHVLGPGSQHAVLPPPPPGMAPPGSRVVLTWGPGMPGPVQVPMVPVMPVGHMPIPVHMMQAAGGPLHGPNGGLVQKNGSAAESVRAPHSVQPQTAPVAAEADCERTNNGADSAAAATATALDTIISDGGPADADGQDASMQLSLFPKGENVKDNGQLAADKSHINRVKAHIVDPAAQQKALATATEGPEISQIPAVQTDEVRSENVAVSQGNSACQQQRSVGTAASSLSSGLAGCAVSPAQKGSAPMSLPSWSSVAARRESSVTSSNSSYSQDPFPSLVSGTTSMSSGSGGDAVQNGPSLTGVSWKAKLQQNAHTPAAGSAGSVVSCLGHKSPASQNIAASGNSPPAMVRGASPRGTINGNVALTSSLSDSAIANSSSGGGNMNGTAATTVTAPPMRPLGNRPTSSALLSGAPTPLVGSLSLLPPNSTSCGGITYHPAVSGQPRKLQLVRGLQNLGGQHNCFLNVIIQSLWHLRSFREAILQLNVDEIAARGAAAADVTVLRALVGVFRAMAVPIGTSGPVNLSCAQATSPSWVVSPLELREALSVLETGQAVVRLDLSEMHDAFEVLLVLLTCMHRAEAGSGAAKGQDPQLPRRVRVKEIAVAAVGAPASNTFAAHGHCPTPHQAVVPTGYAAAVTGKALKASPPACSVMPCTAAHSLFGIEVLVPCVGDEDSTSCSSNGSGGPLAWKDRQHHQVCRLRRDSNSGVGAAAEVSTGAVIPLSGTWALHPPHSTQLGSRQFPEDAAAAEVEVYTKYFHLVHAQALRKALAALDGSDSGAYFEDVLCAAEAAGAGAASGPLVLPAANGRRSAPAGIVNGNGHSSSWAPGATAAGHPLATLLRFPTVFTLAIVWESLQAPLDALRGTLETLGPRVDLALLFRCPTQALGGAHPPSAPCELRSVICYFGHHYLVFARSEELGLWLMIDDANIHLVGHWSDVVKAMCAKRLQPSLLFYEAAEQFRQH